MAELSSKAYLIRAIYEWCTDNGYTPYIAVAVDEETRIPVEFVRNGQIVLNISPIAVHNLLLGNDSIDFSARFGGVPRNLSIPVRCVVAIYSRETSRGLAFNQAGVIELGQAQTPTTDRPMESFSPPSGTSPPAAGGDHGGRPRGGRATLRRVK